MQCVRGASETGRSDVATLFRTLIQIAQRQVRITTAYFVPDDDLSDRLCTAADRGIRIQILLPGPNADKRFVQVAAESAYEGLLDCGIELWNFQPSMLHAKIMTVDGVVANIGSANLNARSLDEEINLVAMDPELVRTLDDHFGARSPWLHLPARADGEVPSPTRAEHPLRPLFRRGPKTCMSVAILAVGLGNPGAALQPVVSIDPRGPELPWAPADRPMIAREESVTLPSDPTASAEARRFTRQVSARDANLDTIELLASELVTDAVADAGSHIELVIYDLGDRTRVEVTDTSARRTKVGAPRLTSGVCLHLIGALADRVRRPSRQDGFESRP